MKKLLYLFLPFILIAFVSAYFIDSPSGRNYYQEITIESIEHAEILSGLRFSVAERDSMLDGLKGYQNNYKALRTVSIDNSIPPPLFFNPIPVGFSQTTYHNEFRLSHYSGTKLPDKLDDLAFYTIGQLAELLRTRQVTSEELTLFYLERLKKYGYTLEAIVTLTEGKALEQARKADTEIAQGNYRGPLHGIPYGVKDLFATTEYITTWGAMPYKDQMLDYDATVVKKLDEAGAVLVAKLTLGALAWGDVWFGGRTRNPWDINRGSSGSSAGSAAAVSAGLVPFAIGTETWGSIVSPSTVCGVTGLRPTFGRVSRHGAMALSWSMDKVGPITRNVEDAALVFNALYGPDGKDESVLDYPFFYAPKVDFSSLRIGYLKSDFDSDYPFKSQDSTALETLRTLGAELIPIELPDIVVRSISFILSAEAAAAFDELTRSGKDSLLVRQIKNAWPNVFRQSRFIPAVEYIQANRIRYLLIQEMEKLFNDIDLYVAPSWQGNNLLLTNLTGHPSVVVPNGFTDEGLPTSFTFNGRLFDEGTILSVAKAYQDATEFHLKRPPVGRWEE